MMAIFALSLFATADAQQQPAQAYFNQGSFSLQTYAGYMADVTNRSVRNAGATVGIGYYLLENVGLNIEATGCYVDEPGPNTFGGGINLLLRHHLMVRPNWSFFIDVGPGFLEAKRDVPPNGTRFNITFRTGPGFTYKLDEHMHLLIGGHFVHQSNARMWGSDRNPSVNGLEGYIGLMFTF